MPTSAKLAAAVLFAALAWWVSQLTRPLFPEGTDLGLFAEYNAAIGAVIGWRLAGAKAGTTWPNAVAYGLTASAGMVTMALLLYSTMLMLSQSTRKVYEGPVEALVDVVRIMVENLHFVSTPEILATLAVGGVLGGLATEWVARNYQ
jgi:hypothetical protein